MNKLNIALMAGGDSSEREVSLRSASQVLTALDPLKYNVFLVDVSGRDWSYASEDGRRWQVDKNDFSVTAAGVPVRFDYALILIHGTPGEDGRLQGYFDFMRIPYSTCGLVSTVITIDKHLCKQTVAAAGIPVARGVLLQRGDAVDADALACELGTMPWFVKPNASGSSCGVTKVYEPDRLGEAVAAAFAESCEILIEEFLAGREIACGVVVTPAREIILPLTEISTKNDFFDYQAKYTAGYSTETTPAQLDEPTAEKIRRLALRAYRACRCRGIVRVDFMLTADGTPVLIEINSVPGMSGESLVPQQAAAAGMTLGNLLDLVISDTYTPENA